MSAPVIDHERLAWVLDLELARGSHASRGKKCRNPAHGGKRGAAPEPIAVGKLPPELGGDE